MKKSSIHPRITDYVHQFAKETPEHEAVVFGDKRITYKELENRVEICGRALLAMGVSKGDRVAMLCTSRPEFYEVFLAAVGIGAIWMGLNPKYSLDEYRYAVGDAAPKVLLTMAEFEGRDFRDDVSVLHNEFDSLEHIVAITGSIEGMSNYGDFLSRASEVSAEAYYESAAAVTYLSPALLVYTSGSTGRPKGAILSHYGLCFGATVQTRHFLIEQSKSICNMPINHVACVADTCCTTLVVGGTLNFQERFDPALVLQTIERERITVWAGVPTMFMMQLNLPEFEQYDLSSVELILWGGAAMPEAMIKRLQATGARLMVLYGMTETAAHTTYSAMDASLDELSCSIGRPDPAMPCRIVNAQGESCGSGEQGELQFKGEYLLLEYYNRPEATREAFTEDGWFRSGDLGYWREDGAITLVGRMSEMYKSGGYNVYPREIELHLERFDDVAVAAVVGIADPLFQEIGVAFVMPKSGSAVSSAQLLAHCKEGLANYKIPKHMEVLTEMPLLANGKINKVDLKHQSKHKYGEVN